MGGHAVVDAAARQNDLGVVSHFLSLVCQVVGVNADAMASDQARTEWQEIPFRARRLEHFQGVDAQTMKDQTELVHQGDVEVALGVLDDLGRFGHFDRAGLVRTGRDDLAIHAVHRFGDLGRAAARDLLDGGQTVLFVTGVDAFRAVAAEEVLVELKSAEFLQHGNAHFFRGSGVDGGFVDDDVTTLQGLSHRFAGFNQRCHVGSIGCVHGRGNCDDEHLGLSQVCRVGAVTQVTGLFKLFAAAFQRMVLATLQLGDACLMDVEADDGAALAELHGQGQAHIAESDDGEGLVIEIHVGRVVGAEKSCFATGRAAASLADNVGAPDKGHSTPIAGSFQAMQRSC